MKRRAGPLMFVKTCPECRKPFVKGRRATHCEPCRKKLKAWRKRVRNEVRRAKRGLHPGWRTPRLKIPRKQPTPSTRGRYTSLTCVRCDRLFVGGKNAKRCVTCNDLHRREYSRRRDALRSARGSRDGRHRGKTHAPTMDAPRQAQRPAAHGDAKNLARQRRRKKSVRVET